MERTQLAQIMERVEHSAKLRDSAGHVRDVLRGVEPLRAGVNIEVIRESGEAKTRAPNGEDYHVHIRASTSNVARDCGIIPMSAWENGGLANYERNPIVLAFHDYKQPIGISVFTEIRQKALDEYWLFHEESDVSRLMKKLYERGFMRAASVGFIVKEYEILSEEEEKRLQEKMGTSDPIYWRATQAELLETSAVPVPADPKALTYENAKQNARAYGIDIRSLERDETSNNGPIMADNKTEERKPDEAAAVVETPAIERMVAIETENKELRGLVESLEVRIAAIEAARATTTTDSASTETEKKVDTPSEERKVVKIEKRDGETDEDAKTRFINEQVNKALGAPAK